jgi:hypothetical protein
MFDVENEMLVWVSPAEGHDVLGHGEIAAEVFKSAFRRTCQQWTILDRSYLPATRVNILALPQPIYL